MSDISAWFGNEVGRWRTIGAITWSVLLLPPVTFMYLLAANFQIFHPINWIYNCVVGLLFPSSWPYLMLLALVTIGTATANSKHMTVVPCIASSRLSVLSSVLRPPRLLHGTLHAGAGAAIVWALTVLVGGPYAGLAQPCDDSGSWCLNEPHVFVVLHGAVVGWTFSAGFFLHGQNHMAFPHIQQAKFFRVKSQLFSLVTKSATSVLRKLLYFYVGYYIILGYVFKTWIIGNLMNTDSPTSLSGISSLLDVSLLWHTLLTGAYVRIVFSLTVLLLSVYHTEPVEFPIQVEDSGQFDRRDRGGRCLLNALDCEKDPLVQYLGYLDLHLLSKHSPERRQQIFSLSQLGGHPHQWQGISATCLQSLSSFTNELVDYNMAALTSGPMRQLSGDQKLTNNNGLKSTSASGFTQLKTPGTPATANGSDHPKKPSPPATKRSLFPWLTSPLQGAAPRILARHAARLVWAAEALAALAAASYVGEDVYGVVQNTLPDVIAVLLNLYETLEKNVKLAPVLRSVGRVEQDEDGRPRLRAAVKTALYRIVATFGKHLDAIKLNVDQKRKLLQFQEYKE